MMKKTVAIIICIFSALILVISILVNVKNNQESGTILEDSITSQLISISIAAREMIDTESFMEYNSIEDVQADIRAYDETLEHLRNLCTETGAKYIYALKEQDGQYYFVFDTDPEDEEIFIPYELAPVHERAFAGEEAADVMNVDDLYGSFNTGAVPITHQGEVVGIICTDIEDQFLQEHIASANCNTVILIVALAVILAALILTMAILMKKLSRVQGKLNQLAHHDALTNLPNRQSLMEYLEKISKTGKNLPYALVFIDLDNFKLVNDNAGHDAGDELLKAVASYLNSGSDDISSFRPSAGVLNVSARIGGDEFLQVVPGISTEEQAAEAAQKLLDGFRTHDFGRFVEKYQVGLSIGVSLYPYHSDNYHVLIKYADIAMYHAKRDGKNNYRIYDDSMEQTPKK